MKKSFYKFSFVFLLAFLTQFAAVHAQYATGGSSVYRDQVLWITWGDGENGTHGQALAEGTTSGATITVADGQVLNFQFTIENTSGRPLRAYGSGNWSGDILDDLYNIGSTGPGNQLINGISTTSGTANFTIRATATLNGDPFPIKGFVMADAEAINTGTEYIQGSAAGSWYVVEMAKNIGAGNYRAVKTNVGGGIQTLRLGPGTDNGTAAVSFLAIATPAAEVTADFQILGGGTTAIAIGVLAPNADFGDAPASYGDAMHLIPDLVFSPDNIPANGSPMNLNSNDYEAGGLIAPPSGFLGSSGPDAEGGSLHSADALGDDDGGSLASNTNEEDAWPSVELFVYDAGTQLVQPIPCSGNGTVAGWIDFNRNDTFEPNERAAGGCALGVATLTWTIPEDILSGPSYVRLRYASDGNELLSPEGIASDGEVEDHLIEIYEPRVELSKSAAFNDLNSDGQAQAGETISYTFTVTNTGNAVVENIVVTDDEALFTGTGDAITPVFSSATGGSTAAALLPGGVLTYTATYELTQADVDAGGVQNQATGTGEDPKGTPVGPVPSAPVGGDPGDPTIADIHADPSLSFAKTGVLSTDDNTIEYTFTVTNTGNVTMTDVTVTDPKITDPIVLDATTLAPGESTTGTAIYTISQAEKDAGEVENAATVTGTPPTTDPDNPATPITPVPSTPDVDNPGTPGDPGIPTIVDVPADPALSFSKTGVLSADGNTIEYTFTVTNTGNVTMTAITVDDPKITGTIVLDATELAPGESTTGTTTYTVTQAEKDAGEVENAATVTGTPPTTDPADPAEPIAPVPSTPDPDNPGTPGDPGIPTIVDVPADPSLSFSKTGVLSADGNTIEYTFTVTNTGNVTMTDVTVTDPKITDPIVFDATTLAPGESTTGTATYTITQAEKDAGEVENAATVTGTPPTTDPADPATPITSVPSTPDVGNPGTPGDPGIPTIVDVPADPSLSFAKAGVLSADGNTIEYTFIVTNTGNVTMTAITVDDPKITDPIVFDATTLAPGESTTGTATYTVTQAEKDAGEVENAATVTGTPPTTDPSDPAEPITPVPSTPDVDNPGTPGEPGIPTIVDVPVEPALSFAKTGVLSADGNTIEYTFTVTNTGNVTMTAITVDDPKITGAITLDVTELAPGGVATGTATYTIAQAEKDAGEVENLATVTGTPPTIDPDNPATPITPVPSTPDTDNPGTPGNSGFSTIINVPSAPSLTLTKVVTGEGPYAVDDYIDYEIVIRNTGNVMLTGIVVTDDNAEIVSGLPIASLAPNATTTVIARHQIIQADINAGTVVNQATVTGDDPEGNPIPEVRSDNPDTPQPNDPTVMALAQRPGLALTKRAINEGPYGVDDYIDYEIVVRNTGNVTLTDVTVTDNNAEITAGSPIASLAPNATATVIARHQVTQADIDAGTVVNQAKVTGDDPEGNPIPEVPSDNPHTPQPNDPTVVELTQKPGLSLTKRITGEGPYTVGQYINYELMITNTGNVTLTNVVVTDNNAEITAGSPIASLAPGASATVTARHEVTQADVDASVVVNQAKVTGDDPKGNPIPEVPSDNPVTPQPNDPTVVDMTQQPGLTLTKRATDEGPYAIGQYINYEIAVRNTGNVTLTNVTVTDNNADITAGSPIASLAPGASATVIARRQITQIDIDAGTVINQAEVTGNDPDGNPIPEVPSDNPDTPQPNDPTVVELTKTPSLALTKRVTGEGPYTLGQYINYEISVRNRGNVTLTDVVVTDENAEIMSGTPIANLAPNAVATVIARHRVSQEDVDAGTVANQARATGDDPDGSPVPEVPSDDPGTSEPNDPTVVYLESRPVLSLTKGVTSEGPYNVGDQIKYFDIVVTNTGNVTLTDVVITDDNAEIIAGSPVAKLMPGESASVMARHVVTQADVDAGEVINQARVSGSKPDGNRTPEFLSDDPNTPEPGDETVTPIAQAPAIRIDKVADRQLVEKAGDRIGYQLQVTNTGNVTLHDVEITDPLTGFVQQIAQVRPGVINAHTFRTTYTTAATDLVAGKIINTAMVTALAPDGSEVTHTAAVEVEAYFKEIKVEDDDFGPMNGKTGGNAGNVFTNDKVNGDPLVPREVTLTRVPSDDPSPLTLEEDGTVTVAPNTPAGMYHFDYQVCDVINPNNCGIATVTVVVAPAEIRATGDQVTGVNGYEGTSNVINVFTNDQLNGAPVVPEEVTLTLINSDPALRLNPDGSIDVVPGTRGGTYTLEYQICEKLNPDNCSVATVTVTVVNPLKIPNVFTPNGDGRNDQFEIVGSEGFDRIEVTIVNRWGNEVYGNDDYQNDWSGQGLTEGTYYYLITTHLGGTKEVHKGWVLIKRL